MHCPSCPEHRELSAREAILLDYTARGRSLKLAAIELGLSSAGVWRIRQRALEKLGFESVYAFVRMHAPARIADAARALTAAERDIASGVLEGLSNSELACRRGTSVRTIANQLAALYTKVGVGSRLELAAYWAARH
jgi:DNA-binding CsgD family transcriptional regulator